MYTILYVMCCVDNVLCYTLWNSKQAKQPRAVSVLVTKRDSYEYYLVTDLPEITDYEFTNGLGSLHVDSLNTKEEVFDFIKNLKTISFKEINPKDGESIRYID